MMMQHRAEAANGVTVALSGIGLYMHMANKWIAEFMPLITAVGIIGGLLVTIWYYRKCIRQRESQIELDRKILLSQSEQRAHELAMMEVRSHDPDIE